MNVLKKILFWSHLVLGVAGGLVIATLAFTGAAMAFEPELLKIFDARTQVAAPVPGIPPLSAQQLLDRAKAAFPEKKPGGLVLSADPAAPVVVQLAGAHAAYLHPQTGEILGERTPSNFFTVMLLLHIRLSSGEVGNWIITVSNVFFVLLCLTGLYLWWPKAWRLSALRAITRPNFKLRGKALHWNLHNVAGIWALAVLFLISFTGLMMSYPWAANLPYTLTGTSRPADPPKVKLDEKAPRFSLDSAVAAATARAPGWQTLAVIFPGARNGVYRLLLREADAPHERARSTLYLHGSTGAELSWEPYREFNLGRRIRSHVLPLHMGTIAGVPGRVIAFTACLAALTLVFTGYVLTWKRLAAWRARRAAARVPRATDAPSALPSAPAHAFSPTNQHSTLL